MKTAVIGATSQSTPGLFRALAKSHVLPEMRFSLVARSEDRLNSVVRAIRMLSEACVECHDCSQAGLAGALAGANVVLVQVRYGGLEGRQFDETFPLEYDVCGDEGLGPGGLAAAWRSWPALSELLAVIERVCPAAQVFLLTSPGSLLTRLANICWPRLTVRSFCELPWTTMEGIASRALATYAYFGVNHLGCFYGIPGESPVHLKYWRLHFEHKTVVREQRAQIESRGVRLRRLTKLALQTYKTGTKEEINAAINLRHAPWYSHAFAPLLESLITRTASLHFFFSVPNQGWSQGVEADDVLEIPFHWRDAELVRRASPTPPSAELVSLFAPFIRYEREAAIAIISREINAVEAALERHPWISTRAQVEGLARAIATQPCE